MTVNTKIGFLWIFWQFSAETHYPKANCIEIASDKSGQPVEVIFSIKFRLQWFKSRPSMFKDASARVH